MKTSSQIPIPIASALYKVTIALSVYVEGVEGNVAFNNISVKRRCPVVSGSSMLNF